MVSLQEALRYYKLGFSLVPIAPQSKVPMTKLLPLVDGKPSWRPYLVERATEEEIRQWYATYPKLNMAVACGPISGGLVVIDFDLEAETYWAHWLVATGELGEALPVAQTGKGLHAYLRYRSPVPSIPLAQTENGAMIIETRGQGGLCMLPSSTHPDGHEYVWREGSAEQIPVVNHRQYLRLVGAAVGFNEMVDKVYVPQVVTARPEKVVGNAADSSQMEKRMRAYVAAILLSEQSDLAGTMQGGRNAKLNRASYILGRYVAAGLVGRDEVLAAFRQACTDNGLSLIHI